MTAAVMDDRLFVDAVMARVAHEPLPSPARALRGAVASLDRGLAAGAIWTAWHLATARSQIVGRGVRLRSAALLAVLLLMLAIGTAMAAAGAAVVVNSIANRHTPTESTSADGGQGQANGGGIRVLPGVAPSDTPGFPPVGGGGNPPSHSPNSNDPGDDNPGEDNPGGNGSGSDNSGGGGDNSGGDGSGSDNSGGDEDNESPEPTDAPEATDVPEATDAPEATDEPDATDAPDDDGSDDGSDDGGDGPGED